MYSYNGIQHSNVKEQITATQNKDESHRHNVLQKKPESHLFEVQKQETLIYGDRRRPEVWFWGDPGGVDWKRE